MKFDAVIASFLLAATSSAIPLRAIENTVPVSNYAKENGGYPPAVKAAYPPAGYPVNSGSSNYDNSGDSGLASPAAPRLRRKRQTYPPYVNNAASSSNDGAYPDAGLPNTAASTYPGSSGSLDTTDSGSVGGTGLDSPSRPKQKLGISGFVDTTDSGSVGGTGLDSPSRPKQKRQTYPQYVGNAASSNNAAYPDAGIPNAAASTYPGSSGSLDTTDSGSVGGTGLDSPSRPKRF
ncbi:hypothetical protein ABW20_dc0102607 [Dactylellina cionopaga]|nr:hypothetical protein ABW20_dc0102607 [Dactylellina cionopaga]